MSDLTSPLGGDDLAKALRDAYGQGWMHGAGPSPDRDVDTTYRGKRDAWIAQYIARLPAGEPIASGAPPSGSGSHPSDRTPAGSAGYAVSILRAELMAKAEAQVQYWRERQSRETCPEDRIDDDGMYTPMGDEAAMRFGACNGRYSEADWWLKTIDALTANRLQALGTEARSAETFGLGPKDDGPACKATPKSPSDAPSTTEADR